MGRIFDLLKNIFLRRRKSEAPDVEGLRIAFKARYHNFKLLLSANNKVLEIMAEMEEALRGTLPFGMN
ncbi:MAG: hypothetical protein K8R45_13145, partial [Desulfobacterales bacterium]|nr:hypothetical protein [Desulfobacterales bacterium]